MSKLEDKVANILNTHNIKYLREYSFPDLVGLKNTPLRFDFAILKENKILLLIEIDGEQHFKFTKHFHKTTLDFMKAREWDRKKNSYCLVKRIPLIRVPYWDLDKLTFNSLFSNPNYRVKDKYHNDYLINGGVK